jgi:hypothetical protein
MAAAAGTGARARTGEEDVSVVAALVVVSMAAVVAKTAAATAGVPAAAVTATATAVANTEVLPHPYTRRGTRSREGRCAPQCQCPNHPGDN